MMRRRPQHGGAGAARQGGYRRLRASADFVDAAMRLVVEEGVGRKLGTSRITRPSLSTPSSRGSHGRRGARLRGVPPTLPKQAHPEDVDVRPAYEPLLGKHALELESE